jgi:hypothetical protein
MAIGKIGTVTVGKAPTTASVDITDGDNLYYKAAKGWGYPTGPGTLNMVDFYNVLYALATQH